MALILEVVNRAGSVQHLIKLDGDVASIGRGFDNQLILKDPHVDASHAVVRLDPTTQTLRCIDNGSLNGVCVLDERGRKRRVAGGSVILSGQTILLGKTRIRVYAGSHIVPPPLPLASWESYISLMGLWWVLGLLALMLVGCVAYEHYRAAPNGDKVMSYLLQGLYPVIAALLYGGFWTFIGRNSRHENRFSVQAGIALSALTFFYFYGLVEPVLMYNLPLGWVENWLGLLLTLIVAFCLVYITVSMATHLKRKGKIILAAILPFILILSTATKILDTRDFSLRPDYDRALVDPRWQWRKPVSAEEFLNSASDVYVEPD